MSNAANAFALIEERPSMYGTPAQVEAMLWTCMWIWAQDFDPKPDLYKAIKTVRGEVPALGDRAGLSFHDLCMSKLDYGPVLRYMRRAFDLLQQQVL